MERVVSYGTLQEQRIQKKILGRLVEGTADSLAGYTTELIEIDKKQFVRAVLLADKILHGTCLVVSKTELQRLDAYEGKDYVRVKKILSSGTSAWVYVQPKIHRAVLCT